MSSSAAVTAWRPQFPRLHPLRLVAAWIASAAALLLAAGIVPGAEVRGIGGAFVVAAIVGLLNAILPPLIAAVPVPYTVAIGFLLVLALDAAILLLAEEIAPDELHVTGFGAALAVALIARPSARRSAPSPASTTTTPTRCASRGASRGASASPSRPTCRGSSTWRSMASPCRSCAARCATARRRTWRAGWPTAPRAHRLGDRPLVADGRQPGRDPARQQRRHPRLSLGRQGVAASS